MRDALYIVCLFAAVFLLALDYPSGIWNLDEPHSPGAAFASFVTLSPSVHAACIEAARTSWKVTSEARSRPVERSLDSGISLLDDFLPPPAKAFVDVSGFSVASFGGSPAVDIYSLLPETAEKNMLKFSAKPSGGEHSPAPAFSMGEMLSTSNSATLKEIMQ